MRQKTVTVTPQLSPSSPPSIPYQQHKTVEKEKEWKYKYHEIHTLLFLALLYIQGVPLLVSGAGPWPFERTPEEGGHEKNRASKLIILDSTSRQLHLLGDDILVFSASELLLY